MRYEYHATNGEDALIEIDENENVIACMWGFNSERREMWIRDMENGDAAGYVDLDQDRLGEAVPYDDFVETQLRGNRLLATMEA